MDRDALQRPKILLYHNLTARGRVTVVQARQRFGAQLDAIAAAGFAFASVGDFLGGGLGSRHAVVTFDDGLRSFAEAAMPELDARGIPVAIFVLSAFAARENAHRLFLGWDEIRALADDGVHVGCHGAYHVPLDQVSPGRMQAEISQSLAAFRRQGLEPTTFAYPFGRYDDGTKQRVREAGFHAAFTVMKGGADDFEIRRRLLTGAETGARLRLTLSDRFFETRDAFRRFVPRRFLRQEQPIAEERWGAGGFGLSDE